MASNGKWVNPVPSLTSRGTQQALQSLTSYLGGWQPITTCPVDFDAVGFANVNGAFAAEFKVVGDICYYRGSWQAGSSTTYPVSGSLILRVPLPYQLLTASYSDICFGGRWFDASVPSFYALMFAPYSAGNIFFSVARVDAGPISFIGKANPAAPAVGDTLEWNFSYRVQV